MTGYKPVPLKFRLNQALSATAPPPAAPDFLFTGYTGAPGFVETIAVLGITAAAAWIGISTGLQKQQNQYRKIAGWVGGVGSALIGLLYLGQKTGISQQIGIPVVRVSPN